MKKITFSPLFQKKLIKLKNKNTKLYKSIKRKLFLFKVNPKHPSLRLHKLQGDLKNVWSISVNMDFRLLFVDDSNYYFFDLGSHSQVYK